MRSIEQMYLDDAADSLEGCDVELKSTVIQEICAVLERIADDCASYRNEGIRPDEWLLEEWERRARAALVRAKGEA